MNGAADMGGMHGFGPVVVERDEPVFHADWERRVLGMAYQVIGLGRSNIDAFRHGIERMNPVEYLTAGYYGRWLASIERILTEAGALGPGEVDARLAGRAGGGPASAPPPTAVQSGFVRELDRQPRFQVGDAVRPRVASPSGHTRLPRYVAGRRGVVHRVQPVCVFPDSNAAGRGEDPQHLYNVRFDARELWGADSEPGSIHLDLFEPYLEPA